MSSDMEEAREHLSAETLARYVDETLSSAELLAASDHLAICDECRVALRHSLGRAARVRGWEADLLSDDGAREASHAVADPKIVRFPRMIAATAAAAAVMLGIGWLAVHQLSPRSPLLDDGAVAVQRDGAVVAKAQLPEALRERIARAVSERQALMPDFADVRPRADAALMSAPPGRQRLRQIGPVGEVVESSQPELKWTRVEGATAYRVLLADVASGREEQVEVASVSWTPPAPLADGAVYEWEVYAIGDDVEIAKAPMPPMPQARFRIITPQAREELARVRTAFPQSPLLLGLAAAEAGLVGDAEAQFERLVAEQPDSELARDLLESVRKAQPAPSIKNGAQ